MVRCVSSCPFGSKLGDDNITCENNNSLFLGLVIGIPVAVVVIIVIIITICCCCCKRSKTNNNDINMK